MGEMKVEHVLLFLVGAFLVYHMMGKCRRVEGGLFDKGYRNCEQEGRFSTENDSGRGMRKCSEYTSEGSCNVAYQEDWFGAENILCTWDGRSCKTSDKHCSDWS